MKTKDTETAPRHLNPEYERWRWRILFITWLGYVGFYFTRKAYAVAKIGILEDPAIEISKSALGLVDGGFHDAARMV